MAVAGFAGVGVEGNPGTDTAFAAAVAAVVVVSTHTAATDTKLAAGVGADQAKSAAAAVEVGIRSLYTQAVAAAAEVGVEDTIVVAEADRRDSEQVDHIEIVVVVVEAVEGAVEAHWEWMIRTVNQSNFRACRARHTDRRLLVVEVAARMPDKETGFGSVGAAVGEGVRMLGWVEGRQVCIVEVEDW